MIVCWDLSSGPLFREVSDSIVGSSSYLTFLSPTMIQSARECCVAACELGN